ncbi:MAG: site-specific integrase [Acidobacteriota bacterium]|nr:site-specific integrase [Acidobacteriota bacterium]
MGLAMPRGVWEKVPGSGIWWIHYVDAEGKRRREKVGRKGDAIKLYHKRKADAQAGRKLEKPLRQRERTFEEFATEALSYAKKHKANPADDEQKIGVLVNEFGDRIASSLTQQELAAFLDSRKTSPATFNRYRATLSMIYREAIRNGWTERNPARLIRAKKEQNGRIRFLSDEEEARIRAVILKHYSDRNLNEFEIALHTGMRRSEQFSLEWKQTDLKARRIHLLKTKNGSDRAIPLNSIALAALQRQHAISGSAERVFLTENGNPFIRKAIRRWFEEALTIAGIADFSWHCLRHTFCSRLVMAGVPLKTAQELMGHKTIQMTARYAHLSPSYLQNAVEMIAGENSHPTATKLTSTTTATKTATGR